jgi:hypothetical protein
VDTEVTVYLCLFGCILLFFGGMGVLLAYDLVMQVAWGALLVAGIVTIAVALYLRPGVHTRTTLRR